MTDFCNKPKDYSGKVRDIYYLGDNKEYILCVASDRISVFDKIIGEIEGKGEILTKISRFWFEIIDFPNHLLDKDTESYLFKKYNITPDIQKRSYICKRLKMVPLEAVVRGYLAGSAYAQYLDKGQICAVPLPKGLKFADRLPEAIYTPAYKAPLGEHDENISFDASEKIAGPDIAKSIKSASLKIYNQAHDFALQKGIIIADTKFEFGIDECGDLILADELLTPDSSRFWESASYAAEPRTPKSLKYLDKQIARDLAKKQGLDKNDFAGGLDSPAKKIILDAYKTLENMLFS